MEEHGLVGVKEGECAIGKRVGGKVRDRQSGDGNVGKFGVVRWSRKGKFGKAGVDGQTHCRTAVIRWAEWKVRPKNFGVVEFQVGNSLGRESAGFTGTA